MKTTRRPPPWWYDGAAVPSWASALSSAYAHISERRRRSQQAKATHPGIPVIVIGNLIAGGAGKTPLTIAVVERLEAWGWSPGVATRGYGRSSEASAHWVDAQDSAAIAGDEPLLIARRTGVPVRVDARRADAAVALRAQGCDVVVCDDGLQHHALARDIQIEVIDGRRGYGNRRLMPAGPLREPVERAREFDFRVRNLGSAAAVDDSDVTPGVWPMRLEATRACSLLGARVRMLGEFAGQRVHAVAGIGDPERFFETLRAAGIAPVPHAFPDHHAYTAADFDFSSTLPVLMTEKDAVKCNAFAEPDWYSVPVDARLPEAFWIALEQRLLPLRAKTQR